MPGGRSRLGYRGHPSVGGLFLSQRGRSRRRRPFVVVAVAALCGLLLVAGVGVVWLVERDRIPARTTVGGVAVGGLSRPEARRAIARELVRARARPIVLVGPDGTASTTGRELGAAVSVSSALDAAVAVGPVTRLVRLVGLGATRSIPLPFALDAARVEELAERLDERFGDPAVDAGVVIRGVRVSVTLSSAGIGVDRIALTQRLTTLPQRVRLQLGPAEPRVPTAAANVAAARVGLLLAQPRVIRHEGVDATLWPTRLASLLTLEPEEGALRVALDPEGLVAALRPKLGQFETLPVDASFERDGDGWRLVPERPGVVLDGMRIGAALVRDTESSVFVARFADAKPTLTVALAKKLGIRELVAEFTTEHKCCAPRVTNIHHGAEIVDGTVIRSGEEFSLNEVLGERTAARGFVMAPQIRGGRLEDAIGGGVSQIATTVFNAAFFAGVELVQHQPHQFYISRYPMGREATVSWGAPELIWRNDWPAAILVDVATTDTSITVRFFSSLLGREVRTTMGTPTGYVQPRRIVVRNKELKPGERVVIQEPGPPGFSISYTRTVLRAGKVTRDERWHWRYDAENGIVELGPRKKGAGVNATPAVAAGDAMSDVAAKGSNGQSEQKVG